MTQLPRAGTAVYLQEFLRIERTSDLQRKSPGVRGFFREELFSEETSLVKRVPPPGPANPQDVAHKEPQNGSAALGRTALLPNFR